MNLRIKITILFYILFSICSFAQKESKIYDKKGRLIADTTFSISRLQLKRFSKIEDTILAQITRNIYYPEVEREAEIGDSLIVISFIIDKNDSVKDFKLEKKLAKVEPGIVKELSRVLINRITIAYGYNSSGIEDKKLFLAFKFSLSPCSPNINTDKVTISNGLIIEKYCRIQVDPKPQGHSYQTTTIDSQY